jgi:methionyl-tRNA synthetase
VGKVINLASRTARFVPRLTDVYPDDGGLFVRAAAAADDIAAAYEATDFAKATRLIMALADRANEYVEKMAPWSLKKDPARSAELQEACTVALNLFRQLAIYLAPVLPDLAAKSCALFGETLSGWDQAAKPLVARDLAPFEHLMQRIDPKQVTAMIDASKANEPAPAPSAAPAATAQVAAAAAAEPLAATIQFDDFAKIDLRVARIVSAEEVKGAKKILKLNVDLGSLGSRTIFAGIKTAYTAESLNGRLIVVVANLEPKTMSFGTSEGMAIAAGAGATEIFVLSPDSGAQPGMRIR